MDNLMDNFSTRILPWILHMPVVVESRLRRPWLESQTPRLTAICSASGRATLTDARTLLTREIQKIRRGSRDAVVDISIDE